MHSFCSFLASLTNVVSETLVNVNNLSTQTDFGEWAQGAQSNTNLLGQEQGFFGNAHVAVMMMVLILGICVTLMQRSGIRNSPEAGSKHYDWNNYGVNNDEDGHIH